MCFAWNVSNRGCICSYTNNLWIISVQLFIAQWRVLCGRKKTAPRSTTIRLFLRHHEACLVQLLCSLAILNFVVIFDSSSFGGRNFLNFLLKRGDIVSFTSMKCDYTRQSHRLPSSYGIELWYREGFIHVVAGVNLHTTKAFAFRSIYLIHTCGFGELLFVPSFSSFDST